MPLRRNNQKRITRKLFAGQTETVRLLKRGDDQNEGQITKYTLYWCRRGKIVKTGEQVQGEMTTDHRTTWHVPKSELDRVGVRYLNALDRIVQIEGDERGAYWQVEADTVIEVKLFGDEVDLFCKRIDPPMGTPVP